MIKLKKIRNEYVRICLLVIAIAIIGISYTIYYAFTHNGEIVYESYGINQVIGVNPCLNFFQILVIIVLGIGLTGAILYLGYSHFGKISPEDLLEDEQKSIIFAIETILFTILLTLIIVIPTNILLEKYNTSGDYQNTISTNNNRINYEIN